MFFESALRCCAYSYGRGISRSERRIRRLEILKLSKQRIIFAVGKNWCVEYVVLV